MEQEILNRLQTQDELLQKIYISSEKTRKYFLWTFYATVALFVLPLVGLMIAIPALMSTLSGAYGL
ncbi:MAG: hypothetical protein UU88_C0011G0019 [Parcubacteria group bacterium GW2011_GWC1_42_11]|uniref:Uncharacterized protein n=1 Tax=Candidatus Nomurabacteria bacterium GW2011_GWC2_42_20 TaxID=1618756 RepID=A0A0G0ZH33_9BACT|nr:MAG: hypothetical protein UU88_C0011G0019 [Parcubacteria group bacterium GW2011_GWC1_42_11]KKS48060.1 MAG: hypothetical protein UV12_C0003G0019 [Candidatus Nomurabacteria bacterium GW2011_GWC2_42_20]KKS59170.1 MAG: hypothetical protein UV24_C0005G0005 [Candidatus Nomurabacteria bacterium GW2011_GWA2_42_41]KKT09599.1 MAG: hypothetical protein UV86_C0004G0018 [Candidatus Nomurabacteria bacterium GW2011_GWB1_43_20]TAN35515.1 MAG: hypothetical protein EPN27_03780 [Patescibacteria group bacterium